MTSPGVRRRAKELHHGHACSYTASHAHMPHGRVACRFGVGALRMNMVPVANYEGTHLNGPDTGPTQVASALVVTVSRMPPG